MTGTTITPDKIKTLPYRPTKPVEKVSIPKRTPAAPEREILNSAFLGANALPSGVERYLVAAEFDYENRLVLTFDTGERIKTKPIEVLNVEQYVAISQRAEAVSALGDYRLSDEDSAGLVKYYGYVQNSDMRWYILRVTDTADDSPNPITYRYANESNNPGETYDTAWASKGSLTYDNLQDITDL